MSRSGAFDGGWTAEFAIPFKSLRYRPGRAQIWGFNLERHDQMEERALVSHAPPGGDGQPGVHADLRRGNAGRSGGPAAVEEPGHQAVRDVEPDERRHGDAEDFERSRRRCRARREVRRDAEPHRRPHATTPTSPRSRPTSSRSTSRASACSFRKSASSFSRTRGRSRSAARRRDSSAAAAASATRRFCSTAGG